MNRPMPEESEINAPESLDEIRSTYYFLHVPKTAGTSFLRFLYSYFPLGELYSIQGIPRKIAQLKSEDVFVRDVDGILAHEKDLVDTKRLFSFHGSYQNARQLPGPLKILFMMRSPRRRLLSAYEYRKRNKDSPIHKILNGPDGLSFGQFLMSAYAPANIFVRTLTDGVDDLDLALERAESLHFIGFQERFDDSIRMMCALEGWPLPPEVPMLRAGEYADEFKNLDDVERERLDELTALDDKLYDALYEKFENAYESFISRTDLGNMSPPHELEVFKAGSRLTWESRAFWFGWYSIREGLRWSGPTTTASVDFLRDESVSGACLFIDRVVNHEIYSSLKVQVNNIPVKHEWEIIDPDGTSLLIIDFDGVDLGSGYTRITIDSVRTDDHKAVYPEAISPRKVGIALRTIDFFGPEGSGLTNILCNFEKNRLQDIETLQNKLLEEKENARNQIEYRDALIEKHLERIEAEQENARNQIQHRDTMIGLLEDEIRKLKGE